MTEKDQEFLEFVIKGLVDNPDAVVITRVVDEMGVLLTLDIHPDDMGKVIGRQGNTAKAIRTLLRVVGMKHNARVNLKINEPEGGKGPRNADSADASTPTTYRSEPVKPTMKSVDDVMAELEL